MADHYGDAPRWSKVALLLAALLVAILMAYTLPSVVGALYLLWGAS
jgi:threonine/homoserine/homoserine lactone efflux protein